MKTFCDSLLFGSLASVPFGLATVYDRKKVCDILFIDQQLRQIEITEMNVKKSLVTISLTVARRGLSTKEESLSLFLSFFQ